MRKVEITNFRKGTSCARVIFHQDTCVTHANASASRFFEVVINLQLKHSHFHVVDLHSTQIALVVETERDTRR